MIPIQELRNATAKGRWAPYAEAIVFAVILMILNLAFFRAAPGFVGWTLNPYLLLVLAIASRYGLAPGLVASFVCLCTFVLTILLTNAGLPISLVTTPACLGPLITFLFIAFVAGTAADHARERLASSLTLYDQARVRHDRLSTQFTLLCDEKHLLDKQVLSEESTFPALVALFEDLDQLEPNDVSPRIVRTAVRLAGGGHAALYRFDEGVAHGTLVDGDEEGWPPTVERGGPLIERALTELTPVTVAHLQDLTDLGSLAREPIQLACRLTPAEAFPPLVLVMRDLPFTAFGPSRLSAIQSGMDVSGKALGRATLFKTTKDRNVVDPITKACTTVYFLKRLEEEYALARRHAMPLSIVTVQVPDLERRVKKDQHSRLRHVLAEAFQGSLRAGDVLAHHQRPGSFLMLCPFTPVTGAEVVAKRIREKVPGLLGNPDDKALQNIVKVSVLGVEPKKDTLELIRRSIDRVFAERSAPRPEVA